MEEFQNRIFYWGAPAALILLSFIVRPLLASRVARLARSLHSKPLEKIADVSSWIIVPVVVTWTTRFASLPQLWKSAIQNGCYVAGVVVVMSSVRLILLTSLDQGILKRVPGVGALTTGFIPLLRNMITLVIFLLGTILVLNHFGYDVWSLITALGVGSLAVGLAAKETLSHMISGFILIVDRNLRPGDQIHFSGAVGTVGEIGLRSTKIRTSTGSTWIVPNSELVNTKILNFSIPGAGSRIATPIKVSLDTSLDLIRDSGAEILKTLPQADPERGLEVRLQSLLEGHQTLEIGFWITEHSPESQALVLSKFLHDFNNLAKSKGIRFIGGTAPLT